jgi:hypothetical protein
MLAIFRQKMGGKLEGVIVSGLGQGSQFLMNLPFGWKVLWQYFL